MDLTKLAVILFLVCVFVVTIVFSRYTFLAFTGQSNLNTYNNKNNSQNKISKSILESGVSPWAKNFDDTVNLTVIFTEDTSFYEAVEIIKKHGGYYRDSTEGIPVTLSNWHNDLIVIIDEDKIFSLASEDKIKWIDEVPPEPIIHPND